MTWLLARSAAAVLLVALPLSSCVAGPTIVDLNWMAGCWSSDGGEPGSGENWMLPAGGQMLGVNRTVRDGKTAAFEFMRIVEDTDGTISFIASPSGQDTATFTLVMLDDDEVVFENPDHDFPQRILYRRVSSSKLLGRIEGDVDGETSGIDFPMTRTACDES